MAGRRRRACFGDGNGADREGGSQRGHLEKGMVGGRQGASCRRDAGLLVIWQWKLRGTVRLHDGPWWVDVVSRLLVGAGRCVHCLRRE